VLSVYICQCVLSVYICQCVLSVYICQCVLPVYICQCVLDLSMRVCVCVFCVSMPVCVFCLSVCVCVCLQNSQFNTMPLYATPTQFQPPTISNKNMAMSRISETEATLMTMNLIILNCRKKYKFDISLCNIKQFKVS
jgi:hypothetical protein